MFNKIAGLLNSLVIAQPDDDVRLWGGRGCTISEYIEERNGSVVRRTFVSRNCRYPLFMDNRYGIKVKDGLFIKDHMQDDGREGLVKKYFMHKRALLLAIENSRSLPANFERTVTEFNRSWDEQTTSLAELDASGLEKDITAIFASALPQVCESYKTTVESEIASAVSVAENGDYNRTGFNSYVSRAQNGGYNDTGLIEYLSKAKNGGYNDTGLDEYLSRAKNGSYNDTGLDKYLSRAKNGGYNDTGLDEYLSRAKNGGYNDTGLDELLRDASSEDAAKLRGTYQTFETSITAKHDQFVSDANGIYDRFVNDAKKRHGDFVTAAENAHAAFEKNANGYFKAFTSDVAGLKEPYLNKLQAVCPSPSDLQTMLDGIDKMDGIISELNRELDGKTRAVLKNVAEEHRSFANTIGGEYRKLTKDMARRYSEYNDSLANSYRDLTGAFESEYQGLKKVFDDHHRAHSRRW